MNNVVVRRKNRVRKINDEQILKRLDNNVFITEKTINDYVKSFKVYDLSKDILVAEYRNFIGGVYSFAFRDAVNFARRYK